MTLETVLIYASAFFLLVGTIFTFVAALGLLKLNDPMTRLHAPTKAGTVGIGAFLLASVFDAYATRDGSMHELLILVFLFVTAPISAHFIAKANIHRNACDPLPQPAGDEKWATKDVPEQDKEIAASQNI